MQYALLFPGEKYSPPSYASSPSSDYSSAGFPLSSPIRTMSTSPKQTVWALYCRSMLLWNSVQRLHRFNTDAGKAEFVTGAWLEAADIQDALEAHSCRSDEHLMYMTREHVFKSVKSLGLVSMHC